MAETTYRASGEPEPLPTPRWLRPYVALVILGGAVCLAVTVPAGFADLTPRRWRELALFAPLAVLFELLPVRVKRREGEGETTISTTFVFTLALLTGPGPAMAALVAGSLCADAIRRKPWWKALFNGAQYAIAVAAAAGVLVITTGGVTVGPTIETAEVGGILLAGLAFFAGNHVLTGVGMALYLRQPVGAALREDLAFQAFTTGGLLALAPVVVAAVEDSLLLAPIVLLPMAAVYVSAATLVAKDHEALHDPLTGLPNRSYFQLKADHAIEAAERVAGRATIMLIDLDQFKAINDTLGHHEGDALLQLIGPRLQGVLRDHDIIARLGGDEFGVLLPDVPSPTVAMDVADRMLAALEQHFELPEVVLDIDASIGIAMYPEHGIDVATLLQRADVAMYLAKEDRTGYQVYAAERDPHSAKRLSLLHDIRRALEDGQFELFYQPKAALPAGDVIGVEGLLRWRHPDEGLLGPETFIALAERSGLSRSLALFLLDTGLTNLRRWRDAGHDLSLALNLTGRNLHDPGFAADVARALDATGVPATALQLEITEGIVMADVHRVRGVLVALQDLGVTLSLDDFGTGLSSLAHLKQLPVRELKIDKSFVLGMTEDESDAVIVRSTIELARNLGLRTVAEGVEDQRTWDRLCQLGCDVAQGFVLSRPIPADEFTTWLDARVASSSAAQSQSRPTSLAASTSTSTSASPAPTSSPVAPTPGLAPACGPEPMVAATVPVWAPPGRPGVDVGGREQRDDAVHRDR